MTPQELVNILLSEQIELEQLSSIRPLSATERSRLNDVTTRIGQIGSGDLDPQFALTVEDTGESTSLVTSKRKKLDATE